jgi:AcrR family transcriptional regulator
MGEVDMPADPAGIDPGPGQQAVVADGVRPARGRPRRPGTHAAILGATIDLLTEVGVDGTTTNAIAERSGCSKSTIYRRWPTRDALILDALRIAVQGRPDDIRQVVGLERDLSSTLRAAAHRGSAIFNSRIFRAVFPTIARELLAGSVVGEQFRANVFVPIRTGAKARLRDAIDREEIASTIDPDLVFDLVYGGLLYRVLVGESLDDAAADALADLVMQGAAGRRYRNESG